MEPSSEAVLRSDTLEKVRGHGGLKEKAAEAWRAERDTKLQRKIASCNKMSTTNTFVSRENILFSSESDKNK